MRKATKTIISFAVVLIAGLNFIVPAFAQDPFSGLAIGGLTGMSGFGLFNSMAGMSGISLSNQHVDEMDAMWNVLNPDHVYFSGTKHEATMETGDVYDYITVDIGDWLAAQSDFIVNLVSEYDIQDNDTGTISTETFLGFIPGQLICECSPGWNSVVYSKDGLVCGYTARDFYVQYNNVGIWGISNINNSANRFFRVYLNVDQNATFHLKIERCNESWNIWDTYYGNTGVSKSNTSDTTYTSSEVNTSVFDGWQSAKVKIPAGSLQSGWTAADFIAELNEKWAAGDEDQIIIQDGAAPEPVPDTPLGEVPFDDWIDLWGQGIYQQLENQSDTLDLIGSNGIDAIEELENIDTNTEDLVEVAESIDTNIGVGNGILGGIRSLAQSAVNYLEGIAEHVGELVEEIVEGTETLIAGILNQIPQAFSVIFGPIKQASSIWHYVVEWIQSIGAPFQFIWSMASGTSYYIILPVYASLAAAVVLAFFKRFGR